jgi:hypothetical protein
MTDSDDDISTPITDTTPADDSGQSFDESMSADMAKVFDKAEAKAERQATLDCVPSESSTPGNPLDPPVNSIDLAFEKAYDFITASPAEKAQQRADHKLLEQAKANAERLGITLDQQGLYFAVQDLKEKQDAAAKAQGQAGQLPAEYAKTVESVRELYPQDTPAAVFEQYAAIDKFIKSDPLSGIAWLAERTSGLNPLQLARDLAIRFGDETAILSDAQGTIDEWMASRPEAAQLESLMIEGLESGKVRRSGHFEKDLESAYRYAQKAQKSEHRNKRQGRHLDRSLREVYDRMAKK